MHLCPQCGRFGRRPPPSSFGREKPARQPGHLNRVRPVFWVKATCQLRGLMFSGLMLKQDKGITQAGFQSTDYVQPTHLLHRSSAGLDRLSQRWSHADNVQSTMGSCLREPGKDLCRREACQHTVQHCGPQLGQCWRSAICLRQATLQAIIYLATSGADLRYRAETLLQAQ